LRQNKRCKVVLLKGFYDEGQFESWQVNVSTLEYKDICNDSASCKIQTMIEIIAYQERWKEEFVTTAQQLHEALGDLALRIDHIGSTSVPGLAAKDIIDVQVTVKRLEPSLIPLITNLGFEHPPYLGDYHYHDDHQPPGYPTAEDEWLKYFFHKSSPRRVNVHVRVAGKANQRYALLFRDYLRSSPASAEAYAQLKRGLAANLTDLRTYSDVKDPAVDLIAIAAEAWAKQTNWQV
jgi:GrpB-like predicted nucleotidyltransferase (UPF0157 family)